MQTQFLVSILRKIASVALGLLLINLLGSLFVYLQSIVYPHYSGATGRAALNYVDLIFLTVKLAYICICCLIGGMLTAFIGRSWKANFAAGVILATLVGVSGLRLKTYYPISFWLCLIALIIPSLLSGYWIVSERRLRKARAIAP